MDFAIGLKPDRLDQFIWGGEEEIEIYYELVASTNCTIRDWHQGITSRALARFSALWQFSMFTGLLSFVVLFCFLLFFVVLAFCPMWTFASCDLLPFPVSFWCYFRFSDLLWNFVFVSQLWSLAFCSFLSFSSLCGCLQIASCGL